MLLASDSMSARIPASMSPLRKTEWSQNCNNNKKCPKNEKRK
jgi:hypothetical protein